MIQKSFKRGVAMVELIFALVIMGIVLLSAPMLIQQSIQSSNIAYQQEAIAAIASHTGILLSKHWDEANSQNAVGVSPVLQLTTVATGSQYDFSGISFDSNVSGRTTSIADENLTASIALGQDNGNTDDFNDIDDYHNFPITLTVFNAEDSAAGALGDYVDRNITINTAITYADDRASGTFDSSTINAGNNIFGSPVLATGIQSHIKFLQATLTSSSGISELDKNITLNAFSCNLGTFYIGREQYE
jgi:Tfp pilus assembly protein PilV